MDSHSGRLILSTRKLPDSTKQVLGKCKRNHLKTNLFPPDFTKFNLHSVKGIVPTNILTEESTVLLWVPSTSLNRAHNNKIWFYNLFLASSVYKVGSVEAPV